MFYRASCYIRALPVMVPWWRAMAAAAPLQYLAASLIGGDWQPRGVWVPRTSKLQRGGGVCHLSAPRQNINTFGYVGKKQGYNMHICYMRCALQWEYVRV